MMTVPDFKDMLAAFEIHGVRYLIIGGLAFIYHAKPRYTKDMDLWVDPSEQNVAKVNAALAEFGSPNILDPRKTTEILQVGVEPNRVDILRDIEGVTFESAWANRIEGHYGEARANWIGFDDLLRIKERIATPRHQEDARVLRQVKEGRESKSDAGSDRIDRCP